MKNKAFTLAEVLITLSIIGVVAALTIPSLVVKNQEKQTVVQLKKAYNVFSNAFSLAEIEYGDIEGWDIGTIGTSQGAVKLANNFAPFLNIIRWCGNTSGCFSKGGYISPSGVNNDIDSQTYRVKAILADGMSINFYSGGSGCSGISGSSDALNHSCAVLGVDVNGFKKPNKNGQDYFYFHVTSLGIIPFGTKDDVQRSLESDCRANSGDACTAWVLLKENLDYPPAGTGWNGTVVTP